MNENRLPSFIFKTSSDFHHFTIISVWFWKFCKNTKPLTISITNVMRPAIYSKSVYLFGNNKANHWFRRKQVQIRCHETFSHSSQFQLQSFIARAITNTVNDEQLRGTSVCLRPKFQRIRCRLKLSKYRCTSGDLLRVFRRSFQRGTGFRRLLFY